MFHVFKELDLVDEVDLLDIGTGQVIVLDKASDGPEKCEGRPGGHKAGTCGHHICVLQELVCRKDDQTTAHHVHILSRLIYACVCLVDA